MITDSLVAKLNVLNKVGPSPAEAQEAFNDLPRRFRLRGLPCRQPATVDGLLVLTLSTGEGADLFLCDDGAVEVTLYLPGWSREDGPHTVREHTMGYWSPADVVGAVLAYQARSAHRIDLDEQMMAQAPEEEWR